MNPDLQTLYDFLVSVLPAALVGKALAFGGVVASFVGALRLWPWFRVRRKILAPVVAAIVSLLLGFVLVGFVASQWLLAFGLAAVIFLVAVGGVETVKNAVQVKQAGAKQNKPAA